MTRKAILTLAAGVFLAFGSRHAAADESNEAEKLFRQMEERLAKAKSIEMGFEVEIAAEGQKTTIKGSLLLAEGNKLRFAYRGKLAEKEADVTQISDGKKVVFLPLEPGLEVGLPAKGLEGAARTAVSRHGILLGLIVGTPDGFGPVKVSDFKLGKKEKVGDRQAQAVEYRTTFKGDEPMATVIWIDIETKAPLKRLFRMKDGSMTEAFREVKLDGKIDPKKFELPAKGK